MDPMQWLMKKIVSSSFHTDQEVKFVNLRFSYLWKEQVTPVFDFEVGLLVLCTYFCSFMHCASHLDHLVIVDISSFIFSTSNW